MTKKYKFRISEMAFLKFSKEDLDSFQDVEYIDDKGKGKIIPIKRFDHQTYYLIVPIELIEECEC